MHLQLVGRLPVGEIHAKIELGSGVLPEGALSFELINLTVCQRGDATHTHFPEAETSRYPAVEAYENYVEEARPRPQPIGNRRRTMVFVPYLPPINAFVDDEVDLPVQEGVRVRRSAAAGDGELEAIPRMVTDYQLLFTAGYNKPVALKEIGFSFGDLSFATFAAELEKIFTYFSVTAFGGLAKDRATCSVIDAADAKDGFLKFPFLPTLSSLWARESCGTLWASTRPTSRRKRRRPAPAPLDFTIQVLRFRETLSANFR